MLKSLEIHGFKSFADRIRFDFDPGITGVVGPNGSGKSNVVDAVKWILGDQSAKSLRGKEMIDVIFNGASGRKPSAFAEATLTFDNSTGFLPVEGAEVQIGRRIYRTGEAEYLINRAPARLKDVRELFLGTGAGSSNYCIIEQGRVEQILQANMSARRMVFEEAAGISRFKSRKQDAERKLEKVDQNVARLTDIVDEVEAQLHTIRSQAVKAAKYREISEQLKSLWLGYAADQHRHLTEELRRAEDALHGQQGVAEEYNRRLSEIEKSLATFDEQISQLDEQVREVEGQRSVHREEAARHEATLRHQTTRLREMEADLQRLRRQCVVIESRARRTDQEIEAATAQAIRLEEDLLQRTDELAVHDRASAALETAVNQHRKQLDAARAEMHNKLRQLSEAAQRCSFFNTQADQQHATIAALRERSRSLEEQIALAQQAFEQQEQAVLAAEVAVDQAAAELAVLERDRLATSGIQEQFLKSLSARREQRSAGRARKSVLEDLERQQEGLGIGVKEILGRAASSQSAPWNEIVGTVADLLEADIENAALVEIALGRRAQAIVIKRIEPLIAYLQKIAVPIAGRVGFVAQEGRRANFPERTPSPSQNVSFEDVAIQSKRLPDLRGEPGVQCRADELARSPQAIPGLAEQLLSDAWIVDTLPTAMRLARGRGCGCRFVTLQGELVDSDSMLTIGSLRSETTLITQKSELRRLRGDLVRLDRDIARDEQQLNELLETLTRTDSALEAARLRLHAANIDLGQLKLDLADRRREFERISNERDALGEELREQEEHVRRTLESLESQRVDAAVLDAEIESARQRCNELEFTVADNEARRNQFQSRRNAEHVELVKHQERLESARQNRDRLAEERRQLGQQQEEAERRLQQVLADRRRVDLHVLNLRAQLAEAYLASEAFGQRGAAILAAKEDRKAHRAALVREESQSRDARRQIDQRVHGLVLETSEMRQQLEALSQRIEEEYQVSLIDVVRSGASAIRDALVTQDEQDRPADQQQETFEGQSEGKPAPDRSAELSAEPVETSSPKFGEVRKEIEARINRLRRQLKMMGSVNTESLRDLDDLERRFAHLSEQLADLVEAKRTLEEILRRIGAESRRLFAESFESIRAHFRDLFRKFFGGGEGDIVLEDEQDVLECGIEVVARPPGKELRSISLLSGGEKTLTAVALLLAIFKSRPSPFCVLDEVDAALDEANVERFAAVLRDFKKTTQFIMITHSKRSMAAADILYGVTMEESGVSKRLSVRFEDVGENGEIRSASGGRQASLRDRDAA